MVFKKVEKKQYRGQYLIWVEDNEDESCELYSTDSVFWRDFFDENYEKRYEVKN